MVIRLAEPADLPAIAAIYDPEVLGSTVTLETDVRSPEEYRARLRAHPPARHPVFVADVAGQVVGWASLTAFSPRPGYDRCAEVSVYIHAAHRGCGHGRALLQHLVAVAPSCGVLHLLARIEGSAKPSLALHAAAGFERVGTLRRVGEKLGRVVDVVLMERVLDA